MSAASKAVNISEILLQILSDLPPLDIIRVRRVNRDWYELITHSHLLQYKAWLRYDFPNPVYHVQFIDRLPSWGECPPYNFDSEGFMKWQMTRHLYHVAKHLNPIIVAMIMDMPQSLYPSFEPNEYMKESGFGGSFRFRPILIRALMQWYEVHKSTENIWGNMSLYRPHSRKFGWVVPGSDDLSVYFSLEARQSDDPNCERYTAMGWECVTIVNKRPNEPLFLTMSDLMASLRDLWGWWLHNETETHQLSHNSGDCDYRFGFPDDCVDWSNSGYDREQYIDRCIEEASR